MIEMIKVYRLKNMEDELERLETKILSSKTISRFDLQELEGLAINIAFLRKEMGKECE